MASVTLATALYLPTSKGTSTCGPVLGTTAGLVVFACSSSARPAVTTQPVYTKARGTRWILTHRANTT